MMNAPPLTGDQYMAVLEHRRREWEATHLARERAEAEVARIKREFPHANPVLKPHWQPARPLLEWFIREGDEDMVQLPEPKPAPKRERQPRVYRTAASLRDEYARVQAQLDALGSDDHGDMAVVNLSPYSRSRAARNAGRRRFAKLDRDLQRAARLRKRLLCLASRIASAEARERKA